MDFLALAKHGLNKTWIRVKFGLILEDQTVEREWGVEKREEEEEEGRREEEDQKGMFSTWDQVYFDFQRLWFGEFSSFV